MRVSPDAWLLKGGVALEYRLQQYARATSDIDISARGTLDSIADALQAAAAVKLEDYFAVRIGESSQPVDEIETYRFSIDVLYENGREFERIKIDVGFADPWLGEAQALTGPTLLDFAGIEPAHVRAIPIGQHLAEKIHAYTKRLAPAAQPRVKESGRHGASSRCRHRSMIPRKQKFSAPCLQEGARTQFHTSFHRLRRTGAPHMPALLMDFPFPPQAMPLTPTRQKNFHVRWHSRVGPQSYEPFRLSQSYRVGRTANVGAFSGGTSFDFGLGATAFSPYDAYRPTLERINAKFRKAAGYSTTDPLWLVLSITDMQGVYSASVNAVGQLAYAAGTFARIIVTDGSTIRVVDRT